MDTHDLIDLATTKGWRIERFSSGTVDAYLTGHGPVDRMVRCIPEDPTHAMCADRGGERVVCSIESAAAWLIAATVSR